MLPKASLTYCKDNSMQSLNFFSPFYRVEKFLNKNDDENNIYHFSELKNS